jgi:hypothetical protein
MAMECIRWYFRAAEPLADGSITTKVEVHPTHWREWHKQMTPHPEPGAAAAT